MPDHPILDRDRQKLPDPMTDEEMEDFLTEAIGLYAEQTKTPVARIYASLPSTHSPRPSLTASRAMCLPVQTWTEWSAGALSCPLGVCTAKIIRL
jgi:hypothetical protein